MRCRRTRAGASQLPRPGTLSGWSTRSPSRLRVGCRNRLPYDRGGCSTGSTTGRRCSPSPSARGGGWPRGARTAPCGCGRGADRRRHSAWSDTRGASSPSPSARRGGWPRGARTAPCGCGRGTSRRGRSTTGRRCSPSPSARRGGWPRGARTVPCGCGRRATASQPNRPVRRRSSQPGRTGEDGSIGTRSSVQRGRRYDSAREPTPDDPSWAERCCPPRSASPECHSTGGGRSRTRASTSAP